MIRPIALIGVTLATIAAGGAMKAAPSDKPEQKHEGGTVIVSFFHDGMREKRLIEQPRAAENTDEQGLDNNTIKFAEISGEQANETPSPKKPEIKHSHKMRVKTLEHKYNDSNANDEIKIAPQMITAEENNLSSPDNEYARKKSILDERFSHMFTLKAELDERSKYEEQKWNEYHALNKAYQRELKGLIAQWVTDLHYAESV